MAGTGHKKIFFSQIKCTRTWEKRKQPLKSLVKQIEESLSQPEAASPKKYTLKQWAKNQISQYLNNCSLI